tara:strand:- start:361 stop:621 length:261 start_codon:yes stop_codon:yes gene_type:complete
MLPFVLETSHYLKVQTHGGVVIMLTLLFTLIIGMKYAVVWMKNKKKKSTSRQEAIFYNLEDAALWEQHINKTEHAKTNIIPIFSDQ